MAKETTVNAGHMRGAATAVRRRASAERPAPRKAPPRLGQTFLRDRNAAAKIVDALGDIAQRTIVEIGPGTGILTELLAAKAGRLVAIELDRVLAAQLRMKYARMEIGRAHV